MRRPTPARHAFARRRDAVAVEVERQPASLPRRAIAEASVRAHGQ